MISTALRLIDLLRLVPTRGQGATARELKLRLAGEGWTTHLRSVQRDLQDLSVRFPLVSAGKHLRWKWATERAAVQIPGADPTGAVVWSLVESHLGKLLPPALLEEFKPHFRAAEEVLRRDAKGRAAWPARIASISSAYPLQAPDVDEEIFRCVSECLQADVVITVGYRARYQAAAKLLDVHPLGLLLRDQTLYLIGTVGDHVDPVQFALHRVERAQATAIPARRPAGFDMRHYSQGVAVRYPVGGGSLRLRLHFTEEAGFHLTEASLSKDQRIVRKEDGTYVLTATVADTAQLRWWLLGFGAGVEVIRPAPLRREIAANAAQMASIYRPCSGRQI